MAGGTQNRIGVKGVIHGFPRVPMRISDGHVLRRFLQDLRDSLNEYRWLFGGLAGLSDEQQNALTDALIKLLEQELEIKRLRKTQASNDDKIDVLIEQSESLLNRLEAIENTVINLDNRILALESQANDQQVQINNNSGDISTIQSNCC